MESNKVYTAVNQEALIQALKAKGVEKVEWLADNSNTTWPYNLEVDGTTDIDNCVKQIIGNRQEVPRTVTLMLHAISESEDHLIFYDVE